MAKVTSIGRRPPLTLTSLASIEETEYRWIWDGRIAVGTITLIAGEEGIGKSTVLCQIAASVTNGTALPDETGRILVDRRPGVVGWLATEDSLAAVLKKRLTAAGANLDAIFGEDLPYRMDTTGRKAFEAWLRELKAEQHRQGRPGPCLVVMDPAQSYLKGNSNVDGDVINFMDFLKQMAEKYTTAMILLRHPNKSRGSGDSSSMILGSKMWRSSPRSVLIVGKSPEDDETAIIHDKSNLVARRRSIGFELVNTPLEVAIVRWLGISKLTMEDLTVEIQKRTVMKGGVKEQAIELILEELADGTELTKDELEKKGLLLEPSVSWKTMNRALKELGAINRKGLKSEEGKSIWRLPTEQEKLVVSLNGHGGGD